MRMVIDYRPVNNIIEIPQYPLGDIQLLMEKLMTYKYYSQIDLAAGYHQLKLADECRYLTSFVVPQGQYQFTRLPFGISSAPSIFSQEIQKLLRTPNPITGVYAYMDDIFIAGNTLEELKEREVQVEKKLERKGIIINKDKSQRQTQELRVMGFIIRHKTKYPDPRRIEVIDNVSQPRTLTQWKRFLGMISYFRQHIPEIARNWPNPGKILNEPEHVQVTVFQDLKKTLKRITTTTAYNENSQLVLYTDYSPKGIAAALFCKVQGVETPVAFFSRKCSAAEEKYSAYKGEATALQYGLIKCRPYLTNKPLQLRTDHHSLIWLLTPTPKATIAHRWLSFLSQYPVPLQLSYVKGLSNPADFWSRIYPPSLFVRGATLSITQSMENTPHSNKKQRQIGENKDGRNHNQMGPDKEKLVQALELIHQTMGKDLRIVCANTSKDSDSACSEGASDDM